MDEPLVGPHRADAAGHPVGPETTGPRTARPDFDGLVLVCRKCLRRQGLERREAGRRLKRAFERAGHGRKLRVVATGCLGPCPKRLLAVATPAQLMRGQVGLVDPALPEGLLGAVLGEAAAPRPRRSRKPGVEADA